MLDKRIDLRDQLEGVRAKHGKFIKTPNKKNIQICF